MKVNKVRDFKIEDLILFPFTGSKVPTHWSHPINIPIDHTQFFFYFVLESVFVLTQEIYKCISCHFVRMGSLVDWESPLH